MVDIWTFLLCLLCAGLYILYRNSTRDASFPPGPPTTPFIGNLSLKQDTLLETFRIYRKQYGDVFSLIMGAKTMVVVNGLESLKEIFIKNGDIVSERPDSFLVKKISKNKGIGSSSGAFWKEHRAFTLGALREFGFGKRNLESKVLEEVEVLVQCVKEKDGQPFDITSLLSVCVSNVICSITFGHRYQHTDPVFCSILDKIQENLMNANKTLLIDFLPFLRFLPGDLFGIKRILQNAEDINKHLLEIMDEHKEVYDENNIQDYIDVYLKKMYSEKDNPNTTFDTEQLLVTIGDLFGAGTDTTTTTIRWLIVLLITHPDVESKMREEITNVIGSSRFPSMSDKPNMPYTEAVIHEVLRFGCIAPLSLPHGLTRDLNYKGYKIPKDALLIPNLHSALHDPEVFEDPSKFRPARFLDEDGKLTNLDKMIAFSLGRRICLGESLARMEIFLFATALVQRFKFLPCEDNIMPSTEGILGLTHGPRPFSFRAVCI